jgi:hypothetical protein
MSTPAPSFGYQDTPLLPGDRWHVHDGTRPQPRVVSPGTFSSQDNPGRPPADAVVLFDGTDLSGWRRAGQSDEPAAWTVENGYMQVAPRDSGRGGDIQTRAEFGDCQLHLEFCCPTPPNGNGQGRGNSGVFLMGRYEIQVLDNFDNPTYADGTCGAVYGEFPPLVNACRPPGEWQVYDIIWTAPRFGDDGSLQTPAHATVLLNGIVLHNHVALIGGTGHRNIPGYKAHAPTGPLRLQDHGDPVRFRNIWYRPLKSYDEP